MKQPLQVFMIGCGQFSRFYHVPALVADPGITIAGICDTNPDDAVRRLALQYNAPVVDSIAGLPSTSRTGVALITTPHTLHAKHIGQALARGWHVLSDKPFVMKLAEGRALVRKAAEKRVKNAVAFNRRFDPGCLRARAIIKTGGIGTIRFVQTVQLGYPQGWELTPLLGGGGPFVGRGAHMADLIPWLLARKPDRLRSRIRPGPSGQVDWGGIIELCFGALECQMTCIDDGWKMDGKDLWDEVRIFGEKGMIELRRPPKQAIGWEMQWRSQRGAAVETLAADPEPGAAMRNFLGAVRSGKAVECSFKDALLSVEIVEKEIHSAATGGNWLSLSQVLVKQTRETSQ